MGLVTEGSLKFHIVVAIFKNGKLILDEFSSVAGNYKTVEFAVARIACFAGGQHGVHGLPKLAHHTYGVICHAASGSPDAYAVSFFQISEEQIDFFCQGIDTKGLFGAFRLAGGVDYGPLDIDVGGIVHNDIVIVINVGAVACTRTGIKGTVGVFAVAAVYVRSVCVARITASEEC